MKQLFLLAILLFSLSACEKDQKNTLITVTVVENCTGVYIYNNQQYYKIRNKEILPRFTNQLQIDLAYEIIPAFNDDGYLCQLFFGFTDWVKITDIE